MRRLNCIYVRDETFDLIARKAIDERRSPRDQAAVELERLFPPRGDEPADERRPAEARP